MEIRGKRNPAIKAFFHLFKELTIPSPKKKENDNTFTKIMNHISNNKGNFQTLALSGLENLERKCDFSDVLRWRKRVVGQSSFWQDW